MIAIAGGTGRVGSRVVAALLASGERVRVLTRAPSTARFGDRVELARVDYDDPATLRDAFAGSAAAFIGLGTSPRQARDEIALIDAATSAGTRHIVELSVAGAQEGIANPVLECHSQIDAHLKGQPVEWTILRPATYANAILANAADLARANAFGGHAGAGRASLIDTRDVAAVAAKVLRQGPQVHAGRIYELTGPAAVSMHDVASRIGAPYEHRTRDEQRERLEELGLPPLRVEVLLGLDDLFRDEIYASATLTVQAITGRPATAFEDAAGAIPALAAG
jgi:NAD(P)H dehydrogenase (quinone)